MEWVLTDPVRFLRERTELERLAGEVDWFSYVWRLGSDSALQVDVDLVVHGRTYAGRLYYPAMFPNSPPYIRPREASERWSVHQYGAGGSLCLQWRADNWQPHVTGAEIVRSAYELLHTEQQPDTPGTVPSDHRLTLGQELRGETYRFVATPALLAAIAALPTLAAVPAEACTVAHTATKVRFVTKVGEDAGATSITDVPEGLSTYYPLFAWPGTGWVLRSPTFATEREPATVEGLAQWIDEAGIDPAVLYTQEPERRLIGGLVLLSGQGAPLKVFEVQANGDTPLVHKHHVLVASPGQTRLDVESAALAQCKVGIVGLGSIGSKLAVSLARSGIRRFVLVDDDLLLPGNMVRHELTWAAVAMHKAQAVRDQLRLVAADLDITAKTHRLAGQESAMVEAALLNELAGCDLLVDATASPEVFLRLAAVAQRAKAALVWGEVFAGGYGGLIARARPDMDPDPLSVRSALHAHLETLPPAPFRHAIGYDQGNDQPLIAHDSDVGHIATALTRLAIDTALKRVPSHFPYPLYLIGLRQEWVFTQPFDTRPVEALGGGWNDSALAASDEQRLEAIKELFALHQAEVDAHPSPSP